MAFLFSNITNITKPIQAPLILKADDNMARPIPDAAITIIKMFEGLELSSYADANGIWTIGYGTTENVLPDQTITLAEAEESLREHLQSIGPAILKKANVPINNNQYSALLSFAYNCGLGALEGSSLMRLIQANQTAQLTTEFMKWDKDEKGDVLEGLRARRMAEANLYFTPL